MASGTLQRESFLTSCGSAGKEFACNAGDLDLIPGLGRFPWRQERLPTPVSWPGEFHGLNSSWVAKNRTWLRDFHFKMNQLKSTLHFSRLSNKKMANSHTKNCVYINSFKDRLGKTGLSGCAFNHNPAISSLALCAPVGGDIERIAPSRDLYLSLLFGTPWLTAPHILFPSSGFIHTRWLFGGLYGEYGCLVQLMSFDLIKTVLKWHKTQLFSNPGILQPIKRLFKENIMHFIRLKIQWFVWGHVPLLLPFGFYHMRMVHQPNTHLQSKYNRLILYGVFITWLD